MDRYDCYRKIEEILDKAFSNLKERDFDWLLRQIKDTIENIQG